MRPQLRLLCTGGQESPFVKVLGKILVCKYLSTYLHCLHKS